MSGVSVSVVIPARNAAGTLDGQLGALARQDFRGSWEVVIVDNGSADHTAGIVESWIDRLSCLRLIACEEDGTYRQVAPRKGSELPLRVTQRAGTHGSTRGTAQGANRARNAGVQASAADYILLCDADDVVSTGWVSALTAALGSYDLVGGRLDCMQLNTPFIRSTRLHPASEELPLTACGSLPYAVGANMGFHRSVFDAVAGFDELFDPDLGSQDVDFCLRAQYAGFTIGFVPDAVVHYRFREKLRPYARQYYSYALGEALLYAKHHRLGKLAKQSRRERRALLLLHVKRLAHLERLVNRQHRWLYARRAAWLAGSIHGLVRYGVVV